MIDDLRWNYPHGVNGPKILQYSDGYTWFDVNACIDPISAGANGGIDSPSKQGDEPTREDGSPAHQPGPDCPHEYVIPYADAKIGAVLVCQSCRKEFAPEGQESPGVSVLLNLNKEQGEKIAALERALESAYCGLKEYREQFTPDQRIPGLYELAAERALEKHRGK